MKITALPLKITLDGNRAFAVNRHDPRLQEHVNDPRIVFIGARIVLVIDPQFVNEAHKIMAEMQPEELTNRRIVSSYRIEIVGNGLKTRFFDSGTHDFSMILGFVDEIRADWLTLHVHDEDRFAEWLGRMCFRPYRPDPVPIEPEPPTPEQLENLGKRWDNIELSMGAFNTFRDVLRHEFIWQTAEKTKAELVKAKVGRRIRIEIMEILADFGLHLGMVVPDEVKTVTSD